MYPLLLPSSSEKIILLIESWKGSSKSGTFSLIAVLLPLKLLSVNTSVVMSPKFVVEEFVEVELVTVGYAVPDRELATLITSKLESKNKFAQDDFLSTERGITEG